MTKTSTKMEKIVPRVKRATSLATPLWIYRKCFVKKYCYKPPKRVFNGRKENDMELGAVGLQKREVNHNEPVKGAKPVLNRGISLPMPRSRTSQDFKHEIVLN